MNQKQYIKEIIQRSCLPASERKRLKVDLENEINSSLERGDYIEQVIERMGDPDKVAAELFENFADITVRPFREYKSKRIVFGLPLVHIIRANYSVPAPQSYGSRRNMYYLGLPTAHGFFAFGPKAKGFFAVGNFAAGFVAIGNFSAGIVSIGNISAGLLTLGNIALALLLSLGNLAAGLLAAGNVAIGYATAGNVAFGRYSVANEAIGTYTFSVSNLAMQLEELKLFLSGLNAPMPIRAFYDVIDRLSEAIITPASAITLCIALFVIITVIILSLCFIPRKLLDRNCQ